jgi:hypothetical protein
MGCLLIIIGLIGCIVFFPIGLIILLIGICVPIAENANKNAAATQKAIATATATEPRAILRTEILKCTDPAQQTILEQKLRVLDEQAKQAAKKELLIKIIAAVMGIGVFLTIFHPSSPSSPSVATPEPSTAPTASAEGTPESTPEPSTTPDSTPTPEVRRAQPVETDVVRDRAAEDDLNRAWLALSQKQRNRLRSDERAWSKHKDALPMAERSAAVRDRANYLWSLSASPAPTP